MHCSKWQVLSTLQSFKNRLLLGLMVFQVLRIDVILRSHLSLVLDLHGCCYDVFCLVLPLRFVVNYQQCLFWVTVLAALQVLGSTRGILKLACEHFLEDLESSTFKIAVGGISGTTGDSSERKIVITGLFLAAHCCLICVMKVLPWVLCQLNLYFRSSFMWMSYRE